MKAVPRLVPVLALSTAGVLFLWLCPLPTVRGALSTLQAPAYAKDGSYLVPADYREWVYLSSGIDMVYGPKAASTDGPTQTEHSRFDNVFVNPDAYHSFLNTGTWPDKTVLVLEVRGAEANASINHGGHSQSTELMGMEVHLKDQSRFPGGWAFFDVASPGSPSATGKLIPQPASCYNCHQEHAAVNTTFVQFYPTLLPIAKEKHTLSAAYLKEAEQKP